ncbi:PLP-dependent aminotransferase family protein [Nocardioides sp. 616]|uniref:MocR-like transcription factor YczR n=1 Tax=Nocardioides sp. 616 TaxID=2268090 RepID=UPI000CE4D781|nr:PLP-dependent aminotransferase family protein [Nocardioides sp. 616]
MSSIGSRRIAALVGAFDRSPAYLGLAEQLTLLIGDGRIPLATRLPSERELVAELGLSRTTVTRAYAVLREAGYAESRRGAGTYTRVPGGRERAHDRALVPRPGGETDGIDLDCAAPTAPPGLAAAYARAMQDLPAYLGGHGYFPSGLPVLQRAVAATYDARGLPTDPEQIIVTPGALSAAAIVAQSFTGPRDRVLVESPVYPNSTQAIRNAGARLHSAPVDPDGWDLDTIGAELRRVRPTLAYLVPDFQNPTGLLMSTPQRATYAAHLAAAGTIAVVDEAHQALALEGQEMPSPFAALAPGSITLGSASKTFWGGLRLGWIRAPHEHLDRLVQGRTSLDLGSPVLEQLVLTHLLAAPEEMLAWHRARLRRQRDHLVSALRTALPQWRFRVPTGGLALWCQLPRPGATALAAEAETLGLTVSPGPVFAAEGGLDSYLRVPWTAEPAVLDRAVGRLALAWEQVQRYDGRPRARVSGAPEVRRIRVA